MNDETHVGLVNSHTEGDGCHDDVYLLRQEVVLRLRARGGIESRMIGCRLDFVGTQHFREFLHLFPRQAIDDAALACVLLDKTDNLLVYPFRFLADFIIQVRAVERALEFLCIHDAQTLLDVCPHLVGGGSCQRYNRCGADTLDSRSDVPIFRSEIVSPLRYAVRLVDGVERDFHRLQEFHILILVQRLWRHVQQLRLVCKNVGFHLVDSHFAQRRIDIMSDPLFLTHAVDDVHLILHQRNQG